MASTRLDVKLSRFEKGPWGFRLHGGTDFGTPLIIQKVAEMSLSESAGLQPGDLLIAINGQDVSNFRHKEAQNIIVKAGNNFVMTIERGGLIQQIWKPQVSPLGPPPTAPTQPGQVFTKTSLAHKNPEDNHFDVKHNVVPKGFSSSVKNKPVDISAYHKQYNSPLPIYSNESIKEVIDQQSEILPSGTKCLNFKKKNDAGEMSHGDVVDSETLKLVRILDEHQPKDDKGRSPHRFDEDSHQSRGFTSTVGMVNSEVQGRSFKLLQKSLETSGDDSVDHHVVHDATFPSSSKELSNTGGYRSVCAPSQASKPISESQGNSQLSVCSKCQRLITGVFCQVKGKPLHSECFVCSTCHCPLKNIGYYSVGDLLYCQQHIQAAKQREETAAPLKTTPGVSEWNAILSSNKAGMASNAEDFTKEFMSQMFGKSPSETDQNLKQKYNNSSTEESITKSMENMKFGQLNGSNNKQEPGGLNIPQKKVVGRSKPQWPPNSEAMANNGGDFHRPGLEPGNPSASGGKFSEQSMNSQHNTLSENWTSKNSCTQRSVSSKFESFQSKSSSETLKSEGFRPIGGEQNLTRSVSNQTSESQRNMAINVDSNDGGNDTKQNLSQSVFIPQRGQGVLKQQLPGMRIPICGGCRESIRGPFITALGKTWCLNHFLCSQANCGRSLQDVGFVEDNGKLYCEECFGKYLAPSCEKCKRKILGHCLKAMSMTFHPECFVCVYCGKIFANSPFYLEDGLPYCEEDWSELFTTKCINCGFPIEAGDRWVEALDNNYHSQCFNCTLCKKNLEGQGFFVRGGKPFCKSHASRL